MPQKESNKEQKQANQYLKYSGLAMQMVLTLGLAIWGGWSLDKYLNIKFPVFTLSFMLLVLFGIFYRLIKSLNSDNNNKK